MAHPILLYDGLCGFCDGVVQFVLKRDPEGRIRFATLQGAFARGVIERHPDLRDVDSLILVDDPGAPTERASARSSAVMRIGQELGGVWRVLAALLRIVPRFLRDFGYDLVARVRYRIFGRYDTCPIPSPEQRARFLLDQRHA